MMGRQRPCGPAGDPAEESGLPLPSHERATLPAQEARRGTHLESHDLPRRPPEGGIARGRPLELFSGIYSDPEGPAGKEQRKGRTALSPIQRLVEEMRDCLEALSGAGGEGDGRVEEVRPPTNPELERIALLVYESMSGPARTFHTVEHVLDISADTTPVMTVAAHFHDVVYYGIDGGLGPMQARILDGVVEELGDGSVAVSATDPDPGISLCLAVFGYRPGQVLSPTGGLNEFLSAAAAARSLRNLVSRGDLARILACIEATIPFRATDGSAERLHGRLERASGTYGLGFGRGDLTAAVQQAVMIANRDVASFANPQPAAFLSGTWNLLPESNISLRNRRFYLLSDFALAMKKMGGFLAGLDACSVFGQYDGVPSAEGLEDLTLRARANIDIATDYLDYKLLSIGIVYALSVLTGGDGPVSMFLGSRPQVPGERIPIETYLDVRGPPREGVMVNEAVYALLREGRCGSTEFDMEESPLTMYLCSVMGHDEMKAAAATVACPMDEEDAERLLRTVRGVAVAEIAAACARICLTREEGLLDISRRYS